MNCFFPNEDILNFPKSLFKNYSYCKYTHTHILTHTQNTTCVPFVSYIWFILTYLQHHCTEDCIVSQHILYVWMSHSSNTCNVQPHAWFGKWRFLLLLNGLLPYFPYVTESHRDMKQTWALEEQWETYGVEMETVGMVMLNFKHRSKLSYFAEQKRLRLRERGREGDVGEREWEKKKREGCKLGTCSKENLC